MTIEPFAERHLHDCAQLFRAVFRAEPWNEDWPMDNILKRLRTIQQRSGFRGLVALEGNGVIAFMMGHVEQGKDRAHFFLRELAVSSAYQRKGIGQELMRTLCHELERENVGKIYLITAGQSPAEEFYRRCGFSLAPDAVVMERKLV